MFSKTKEFEKSIIVLSFLHISLISGVKGSWILICFGVQSFVIFVLAEIYEENQALYRCVVRKRNILMASHIVVDVP